MTTGELSAQEFLVKWNHTIRTGDWTVLFPLIDASSLSELPALFDPKWLCDLRDRSVGNALRWLSLQSDMPSTHALNWIQSNPDPVQTFAASCRLGFLPIHAFFRKIAENQDPLFILFLEHGLSAARKSGFYDSKMQTDLRSDQNYKGAVFEILIHLQLLNEGYALQPHWPSGQGGGNCDFRVENGSEIVFLELKVSDTSSANKRIAELTRKIMEYFLINPAIRKLQNRLEIELTPAAIQSYSHRSKKTHNAFLSELAKDLPLARQDIIKTDQQGLIGTFSVGTLLTYSICPATPWGSLAGLSYDEIAEYEKLFDDCVKKTVHQIPLSGGGIVLARSNEYLDIPRLVQYGEYRFTKNTSRYEHISAFVVLLFNGSAIIFNPQAKASVHNFRILDTIKLVQTCKEYGWI